MSTQNHKHRTLVEATRHALSRQSSLRAVRSGRKLTEQMAAPPGVALSAPPHPPTNKQVEIARKKGDKYLKNQMAKLKAKREAGKRLHADQAGVLKNIREKKRTKVDVHPTSATNASPSDREDSRPVREAAVLTAAARTIERSAKSWTGTANQSITGSSPITRIYKKPEDVVASALAPDTELNVLRSLKAQTPGQEADFQQWAVQSQKAKALRRWTAVTPNQRGYTPKMRDEKKFAALHQIRRHEDRVGNKNSPFQGVTKAFPRKKNRMGYDPRQDQDA
jgi:hypothetical protein